MIEQKKTQIPLWKNPVIIAASLATLGVVVFGWWAGSQQVCNVDFWGNRSCSGTKWSAFVAASPNEVGDTLAGFAGALAFVWLIAAVVLQGQELREQRLEFEKMADAQAEQVRVLEKQREIFESEQRQREESRMEELLNEKLRSFVVGLVESPSRGLSWVFSNDTIDDEFGGYGEILSRSLSKESYESQTIDEAILDFRRRLPHLRDSLWQLLHTSVDYRLPEKGKVFSALIDELEGVLTLADKLSAPQRERLTRMRLPEAVAHLRQLGSTSELWKDADQ